MAANSTEVSSVARPVRIFLYSKYCFSKVWIFLPVFSGEDFLDIASSALPPSPNSSFHSKVGAPSPATLDEGNRGQNSHTYPRGLRNTSPIHRGSAGDFTDKVGWGLWEELNLVPLALCPSASHLYTFSLSFPLCKIGIITGLLECNGKGYGQGSIQPLTYGNPFRMVVLGRISMRGEGLLDALHLG